jgi:hypothetical protein
MTVAPAVEKMAVFSVTTNESIRKYHVDGNSLNIALKSGAFLSLNSKVPETTLVFPWATN